MRGIYGIPGNHIPGAVGDIAHGPLCNCRLSALAISRTRECDSKKILLATYHRRHHHRRNWNFVDDVIHTIPPFFPVIPATAGISAGLQNTNKKTFVFKGLYLLLETPICAFIGIYAKHILNIFPIIGKNYIQFNLFARGICAVIIDIGWICLTIGF